MYKYELDRVMVSEVLKTKDGEKFSIWYDKILYKPRIFTEEDFSAKRNLEYAKSIIKKALREFKLNLKYISFREEEEACADAPDVFFVEQIFYFDDGKGGRWAVELFFRKRPLN